MQNDPALGYKSPIPPRIILAAAPALVNAIRPPGADTPEFYLVASSQNSNANLKPLRSSGASPEGSTLTGSGPIGIFYMYQGELSLLTTEPAAPPSGKRPYVSAFLGPFSCSTYGPIVFSYSSSNKCARFNGFQLQSNEENSQLGAKVVVNWQGGFYACGDGLDVWYKLAPGDGPTGQTCYPIDLYTVPVV